MFTGIVTQTGMVMEVSRSRVAIRAQPAMLKKLHLGTSVAVNGACLTVVGKKGISFIADIMPETARRTTLGRLRRKTPVNLELPATPASFLSGHIVQGHIDGIGSVKKIVKDGGSHILTIAIPRVLGRYIVPKGSVAINGVSLTIITARSSMFTAGIIPHTFRVTMLGTLAPGDTVNIEVDVLAKYAEKFARKHYL